jgi:probable F420-dependent oxidoreductase
MKFGVAMAFNSDAISPAALAVALEQRGFESIWAPEHSHIPLSRRSPAPGGGDLPSTYWRIMDPFVCLAMAAAVTTTLKLGTGVCLVNQRDPIQTAKAVASLDHLSAGRFLFGVGIGWNAEEMENHGTAFATRAKLSRERIEAMIEIWTQEKAEYHGELVNFDPILAEPKPVQSPHPPIIVGGAFPQAARRAIRYGQGWIPIGNRAPIADDLAAFRALLAEQDRDPATCPVTTFGLPEDPGEIRRYAELGVVRGVIPLPPRPAEETLPLLDRWADIALRV